MSVASVAQLLKYQNNFSVARGVATLINGTQPEQGVTVNLVLPNFVGTANSSYFISNNTNNGIACFYPGIVIFGGDDGTNTTVTCTFIYTNSTVYNGGTFQVPFSVLGCN
jgi:hypothetical protein